MAALALASTADVSAAVNSHCLERFRDEAAWLAFLEVGEYVVVRQALAGLGSGTRDSLPRLLSQPHYRYSPGEG